MDNKKTAVLLMNVGTPDEPKVGKVYKFLTQFLNDKRVIDLPWLLRKFLVNFIIIPFRVFNSTRIYKILWTEKGSPLVYYSVEMQKKLQEKLDRNYRVFVAMRYGNPGYRKALRTIKKSGFQKLIVFPLYPQYAMSTTETSVEAVKEEIKKQKIDIELQVIGQFYNHPKFIQAFAEQARKYDLSKFDHIVFSYHGLPNRHLGKIHPGIKVQDCNCIEILPEHGKFCYRATCFATTRLLAGELGLKKEDYSVAFQSRLSKNWMSPFTDDVLLAKLKEGKKRIMIIPAAFVIDCLETIVEIGEEYRELFLEKGGVRLQLVESLNAEPLWIEAMHD
ncbi:MAG: ferrochelatase, partial [Tangfeifania sp.]